VPEERNVKMTSFVIKIASGIGALALLCVAFQAAEQPGTTSRVVTAANAFLSTLDENQRKDVVFRFDDEERRRRWSNSPVVMVPRAGMSLKQMNATQQPP
jgi:hypothetical protein